MIDMQRVIGFSATVRNRSIHLTCHIEMANGCVVSIPYGLN